MKGENLYPFAFISLFLVFTYVQYFFAAVRNKTSSNISNFREISTTRVNRKEIKSLQREYVT